MTKSEIEEAKQNFQGLILVYSSGEIKYLTNELNPIPEYHHRILWILFLDISIKPTQLIIKKIIKEAPLNIEVQDTLLIIDPSKPTNTLSQQKFTNSFWTLFKFSRTILFLNKRWIHTSKKQNSTKYILPINCKLRGDKKPKKRRKNLLSTDLFSNVNNFAFKSHGVIIY
jgi:hypothetical protein